MITEDITAQKLAVTARNSISDYCSAECKAYCCRQGHILLTAKEADTIMQVEKNRMHIIEVGEEKRYVLDLGLKDHPCKNLKDFKCDIHKVATRPLACKEFPLFIREDKIVLVSFRCPAAKENKLYPYLAKFKKMGYTITYAEEK